MFGYTFAFVVCVASELIFGLPPFVLKFMPPLVVNEADVEAIATATAATCRALGAGRFYGAMRSVAGNMVRSGLGLSPA